MLWLKLRASESRDHILTDCCVTLPIDSLLLNHSVILFLPL